MMSNVAVEGSQAQYFFAQGLEFVGVVVGRAAVGGHCGVVCWAASRTLGFFNVLFGRQRERFNAAPGHR